MDYVNMTKRRVFVSSILFVFGLLLLFGYALAESHTIKAPSTFHSIKLKQEERTYYGYNPFSDFSLTTEGWACGEKYADNTIYRIREINRLIQPLAEAQHSLSTLEKALIQMGRDKVITLSKSNVQNVVYKAIGDAIKKSGFSSERDLVQMAEDLAKDTIEQGKSASQTFGYYRDQDVFKHVDYGTPSGIWKISKMEPDEPSSVVYVAQNCYQKQDLEAMLNAIVSAARKLEEVLKSYKDTRDKVLALGK
jgi:hypothetical protein